MNYIDTIKSRSSIRTYSNTPITPELRGKINSIISVKRKGPFGSEHQFALIDTSDEDLAELGKLTTYGLIRGAKLFFGGFCEPDDKTVIDYGYCFQDALIKLTALELGTCWLGGTINRGSIAKALSVPQRLIIPAVSPVGKGKAKRHMGDRLARKMIKAAGRKPPETLFFTHSTTGGITPLNMNEISNTIAQVLNSVHIAPSASNKQPWRLIIDGDIIHLFWDFDEEYNRTIETFNIQALDMGIALYHIKRSAEELGWKGDFSFQALEIKGVNWRYIASWS